MRARSAATERSVAQLRPVPHVQIARAAERREAESEARRHDGKLARCHTGRVPSPDDLLADAPIGAAVSALAERNRHHLEQMTEAERNDALSHWHDLAVTVLSAAGRRARRRRTATATATAPAAR